jgi:hypothetical protein
VPGGGVAPLRNLLAVPLFMDMPENPAT